MTKQEVIEAFKEALNDSETQKKLNIVIITQAVIATAIIFIIFSLFFLVT